MRLSRTLLGARVEDARIFRNGPGRSSASYCLNAPGHDLVDAGPLIALVHREDTHHQRCAATLWSLRDCLGTTWPVMTEAMHLLSFSWQAQAPLWEMNALQVLQILPLDSAGLPWIRPLMQKYRDLPMDLPDSSLL